MLSRSPWLVLGLAASLAANLFLISLWAGAHAPPLGAARNQGGLAQAARVRRLPPDERARFAAAMGPWRPEMRASRVALRAAREDVVRDIGAPVLDRGRLDGDLARLRSAFQRQQQAQHAGLSAAIAALSPASRALLVGRVEGPPGPGAPPPGGPREAPRVGNGAAGRSD